MSAMLSLEAERLIAMAPLEDVPDSLRPMMRSAMFGLLAFLARTGKPVDAFEVHAFHGADHSRLAARLVALGLLELEGGSYRVRGIVAALRPPKKAAYAKVLPFRRKAGARR